jgi:hypothetical protein
LPEAVKDEEIQVGQQGGVTQKELIDALKQLFIPRARISQIPHSFILQDMGFLQKRV